MMERTPTGISGFDELVAGGFPKKSSTLVCGAPGSCKTIFCLEYLIKGILNFNENGLYVTIEEEPENLRNQAEQFGWNIPELEEQNRFRFLKVPIDTINVDIISIIEREMQAVGAQRIVIDSLSILAINAAMYNIPIKTQVGDDVTFASNKLMPSALTMNEETKQFIYLFVSKISGLKSTSLFVSDSPQTNDYITRDTVSEFVCDGVIKLAVKEFGKTVCRTVEVKKMRSTPIKMGMYILDISKDGLLVKEFTY